MGGSWIHEVLLKMLRELQLDRWFLPFQQTLDITQDADSIAIPTKCRIVTIVTI